MDIREFRCAVIRPTLKRLGRAYASPAAEELLLATAVHESDGLKYLRQRGGGPARSFFQIEPATARWLIDGYLMRRPQAWQQFRHAVQWEPGFRGGLAARLVGDQAFACALARFRYWVVPHALPEADDIAALAQYWGAHYQTDRDPARIAAFVTHYRHFITQRR